MGEKIGSRSFRCRRIWNSLLENWLVGVRRDMLAIGILVSGERREGMYGWIADGE